jgi:hypothetical protein
MENFESKLNIDSNVLFTPMYRHCQEMGIKPGKMYGKVVSVRFTKAKVFYDVLDDYYGKVFSNVDSCNVNEIVSKQLEEQEHTPKIFSDETGEYIIGVDTYPYSKNHNVLKDEIFNDDECDKNPLICQSRYPLQIILKEIQRGRPAESQHLIQTWIDNLNK